MAERPDGPSEPIERLRALDRAIARRGASAEVRERVRRKLQQNAVERPFHARLRWWPAIAFAAGAITMAVLVIPDGSHGDGARSEPAVAAKADPSIDAEPTPGAASVSTRPTCAEPRPGLVHLAADECIFGDGVRVTARSASRLRWEASTVDVEAGELSFDVAPRPGRPLHVTLGDADIEVVGTRFIVHRDATGGWISMLEGHVRTRVGEGPARDLREGERLEWPEAVVQLGAAEPVAPAETSQGPVTEPPGATRPSPTRATRPSPKKPAADPDAGLAALLDEVAALRRAGSYREAARRLRSADTRRWSLRARQLVSYEIGTLLERQLGDVAEACTHWAEHRRRFPGGRHDAIVARSMERLRCAEHE